MAKLFRHFGLGNKKAGAQQNNLQEGEKDRESTSRPEENRRGPDPLLGLGGRSNSSSREALGAATKSTLEISESVCRPQNNLPNSRLRAAPPIPLPSHKSGPPGKLNLREAEKVLVLPDYCDPADLCWRGAPPRGQGVNTVDVNDEPIAEDDYTEPFLLTDQEKESLTPRCPSDEDEGRTNEQEQPDSVYDDVYEAETAEVTGRTRDSNAGDSVAGSPQPSLDSRPDEEYDEPWEWGAPLADACSSEGGGGCAIPIALAARMRAERHRRRNQRHLSASISSSSSSSLKSESRSVDEDSESITTTRFHLPSERAAAVGGEMTGRQRRIYETAFDSVKADSREDGLDLEDLVSRHPILTQNEFAYEPRAGSGSSGETSRNPTPRGTPKGTPGGTPKPVSRRPAALSRSRGASKERTALTRDSLMGGGSGPALLGSSGRSPDRRSGGGGVQEVQAVVHSCPPRSANSTPTLSYRAKEGFDSRASSAKSTPTHFLSKVGGGHHHHHLLHHLPLRQFSDLNIGENRNTALNSSTSSMPPSGSSGSSGSHRSRQVEMMVVEGRLPCEGAVSSEESVASTSSSSSSSNNNSSRGSVDNHRELKLASRLARSEHGENQVSSGTTTAATTFGPKISTFHLSHLRTNSPMPPSSFQPSSRRGDSVPDHADGDDGRPADEYDPPWEFKKNKTTTNFILNLSAAASKEASLPPSSLSTAAPSIGNTASPSASVTGGSTAAVSTDERPPLSATHPALPPLLPSSRPTLGFLPVADEPKSDLPTVQPQDSNQSWASNDAAPKPNRPNFLFAMNNSDSTGPSRNGLALNFNSQSPKRKRRNLQLNFGCAALSVLGEPVDETIPLDRQGWYHGAISRFDAEGLLRVLQEGSYLVRNSESSKQDYSLSLKSARGFMHMKIVFSDGKYILGQFSKPFSSIPEMIHHYSINKLPIKGAEHMSLLHPVIDQLL